MASTPIDFNETLKQDIVLKQGDTWRKRFTLKVDTGSGPTAVNLTNITWAMTVSDRVGGTSLLAKTTDTDWTKTGVHVDTAADGTFTVNVLAGDGTTLGVMEGVWELTLSATAAVTNMESVVRTLMAGRFVVQEDVVST
jgi:hypothetical protein